MNTSVKCNCCAAEKVCKFKEIYERGVESVLGAIIMNGDGPSFWWLKDCPHIEVSIRCPHIIHQERKEDY